MSTDRIQLSEWLKWNRYYGEGVLTGDFLREKGFALEGELMMSRFITVAGMDKQHELILYHLENLSNTGYSLKDFYFDDDPAPIWKENSVKLKERSLQSFTIK